MKDYHSTYAFEKQDRETFWLKASKSIDWITPPKIALDDSNSPFSKWFPDGKMNSCFNAVDRHVLAGRQEQTAIQYESPITGRSASMSYGELKKQTEKFAGMLIEQGLKKGD